MITNVFASDTFLTQPKDNLPIVMVNVNDSIIEVSGNKYSTNTLTYIDYESNSTMVPLRYVIAGLYGYIDSIEDINNSIIWDNENKTATIYAGSNIIVFKDKSNTITVNNIDVPLINNQKIEIKDGVMYVPFRIFEQVLPNVNVFWNSDTMTAVFQWDNYC